MVSVVKSEWHQFEKRYGIEIDADILSEIYPDLNEDEIEAKLTALESGEEDIEEVFTEAWKNNVDIKWVWMNEDDWWTERNRKGEYEVSYKVREWEVREEYVAPITHKCTKCEWIGSKLEATLKYKDKNFIALLDNVVTVCPRCDSSTVLTGVGVEEEAKDAANKAKWNKELDEALEETEEE